VKLPPNRLSDFLRKPPPEFRAVLFYGPDTGLVRERADRTTAAICPDLKDPFRIAELSTSALAADPARLSDEIGALSLVGGRRVVRIRDAGDSLTALLGIALAESKGDSMIVIEGGDLPSRSSLRKLCEAARDVAVGACYADGGRDIAEIVRETLRAHDVAASSEAVSYLVAHLGNDRLVTRSELEKLALYAGNGGRIELADAVACVGDSTALSLDDVIFAAADGDAARLEGSLFRCLQEGQSAVGILRAVMRHFQRLHLAASRMSSGASADEALRAVRPPIFFKQQERFKAQLMAWPVRRAAAALDSLTRAELNSKRAVLPQETILREALFSIARAARRQDRSSA
jgi:DNA polymerase-3 subunit delta